jgi:superfamily II DNA or RNA helicase
MQHHIDQLKEHLHSLESQKRSIEAQILQIKQELEKHSNLTKEGKIALYRSLFIGREDVYATYWISGDGLKKGYFPKTVTFKGSDYLPLSDAVIQSHLEGKVRIGTYAVKEQSFCSFLAIDLDKSSFLSDARAINIVCLEMGLFPSFEISKSGNGIHIWIFFSHNVRSRDARILGDLIITKAMDHSDGIDMKSFDRLFPNQDYVPYDGLGNLIALPLHYGSRNEEKTVFVDIDALQPYSDQWSYLSGVSKVAPSQLSTLIQTYVHSLGVEETLMPWEIEKVKLSTPKQLKLVLHDSIYIEFGGLSKSFLNLLKRMASFYNPEFYMRQKQRLSTFNTPRIISTYDLNERYIVLPRGLLEPLRRLGNKHKIKLEFQDKRLLEKISTSPLILELRPQQVDVFNSLIHYDYALLIAPPGFGKTAVASAIIAQRSVKTLILVNKTALINQWKERLMSYFSIDGKAIGILGKGKKSLNGILDIATLQSLKNRPELIEEYSQIIIDEAHHIPAVSFEIPLKRFKGKYVVGLSATPKRKDGMEAIMRLQCGEIVHEIKKSTTQRHHLKTVPTQYETLLNHFSMILGELSEDHDRNQLIIDEIKTLKHRKVLVLSERIEHLNRLWHHLKLENIDALLLYGAMGTKMKREQFAQTSEASIILSTSSYIGEGIDIGHLDTIVFTMPISYDERMVQYLGRIGRQGQECLAIDFIDHEVPLLKSSFTKRLKGYKKMGYGLSNLIENVPLSSVSSTGLFSL